MNVQKNSQAIKPLPSGWRWAKLGEVCEIIAGQSPPGHTYRKTPEGLPFFQGKADFGNRSPIPRVWCVEPTKIANAGDILISVRAPVGPTNVAIQECCIGRGLAAIRCGNNIKMEFLLFWLKFDEGNLEKKGSGSTFGAINRKDLEELPTPLPPFPEQQRIAAILNEQMAAVEKARAAAEAALETANTLPAAYLKQVFPKPGQVLPAGWRWVKLGEVILEALPGFAIGERDPKGVIQLRMNNVDTRGRLHWDEFIRVPAAEELITRYGLQPGDVVFNNTNSTELVGKSALFIRYSEPIVYSNHFTRLRTKVDQLDSTYLAAWLLHQWQKRTFENLCNRWIGQSAVKNDKLLDLELPLSPLPEQKRIAGILNEQMAGAERLRNELEAQLHEINALPAALLIRAFSGEL